MNLNETERVLIENHLRTLYAVGETKAARIVAFFGDDVLAILDGPEAVVKLLKVPGIASFSVASRIVKGWRDRRSELNNSLAQFATFATSA